MSKSFYTNNYSNTKIETTEQPQVQPEVQTTQGIDSLPQVPEDNQQPVEATENVQESAPQEQQEVQTAAVESAQAKNFRQLKEAKERAERERDELSRYLKDQLNQQKNPTAVGQIEEEDDLNINPDDIVEGKHLKKYVQKVKKIEQNLQQQQQVTYQEAQRARLNANFPDFNKVVNNETLQLFSSTYPELANTLNSSNDLYSVGVSAYTMIKNLGLYKDDIYEADRARVQNNASKPKPLASIAPQKSESPLSHANAFANGLTDDVKKQLWREMQELRRRN